MPTANLPGGSPSTTSNSSDGTNFYSSFTVPQGRAMQNGSRNVFMESFILYVAGRSGNISARAFYAGAARGSNRTIGALATPVSQAFEVNVNSAAGSTQTYGFYSSGGCNFRRGAGGGTTTKQSNGYQWGTALSGTYTYSEAPPAPDTPTTSLVTSTSMRVSFSGNGDGGSPITAWKLQRATNAAFTQNVVTVNSSGTTDVTGLTPNMTYYFRACGENGVTKLNGPTLGPWSGTKAQATTTGAPTAPLSPVATALSTSTTKVDWAVPANNGGSAITRYDVQYANNAAFTGATTADAGNVLTWTSPPLTTGTWYFRVRAINANGDGAWSTAVSNTVTLLGYVKTRVADDFIGKPAKVYLSGAWAQKPMKVYKNGSWVTLP